MRSSRWLPVAGWCLATATSIVLSSVALSPVLDTARAEVGALPDLDQLPPAEVTVTTTATAAPATPVPDVPETPEPSEPAAEPTAEPSTGAPTRTSRKPASKPATSTTPPAAPAVTKPSTTTQDGWTVTTGDDGNKTYVRAFTTEGGRAVIKMTSDGIVSLVTATPADGYTVLKTGSSTNLAVYFNATGKSFIIHAQWWNGAPFVEVSEVGS